MKVLICCMLILWGVPTVVDAQTSTQVALVTSVTGKSLVAVEGREDLALVGRELPKSASLRVVDGTAAVVFLSGDFVELKAGESIELGADAASSTLRETGGTRGADDAAVKVTDRPLSTPSANTGLMNLAYVPGVRGDALVTAIAPRLVISEARPTFYWFDPDSLHQGESRQWVIVVRDETGKTLAQKTVQGTVFTLQSTTLPELGTLASGHRWSWGIFSPSQLPSPSASLDASFVAVDEEGRTQASARRAQLEDLTRAGSLGEESRHTLLALYYLDERERLFSDALPHLLWLKEKGAAKEFAQRHLLSVLSRFGNQVAAVLPALVR